MQEVLTAHGPMRTEIGLGPGGCTAEHTDADGRSCSRGSCQAGRWMALDAQTPSRAGSDGPGPSTEGQG